MFVAALIVAVAALVLAVACVGTGSLGAARRLPQNRWVGIRTPETMRSPEVFTLANRVAGPGLVGAGLIAAMGAAVSLGLSDGLGLSLGVVAIVVAAVVASLISGYAVRVAAATPEPADACGVSGGCGSCALSSVCAPGATAAS